MIDHHIDLGTRVIPSLEMVESYEDWSQVRSHSRATRRLRQGHRQNIVTRQRPRRDAISMDGGKTIYVHPVVVREIEAYIKAQWDRVAARTILEGVDDPSFSPWGIVPPSTM